MTTLSNPVTQPGTIGAGAPAAPGAALDRPVSFTHLLHAEARKLIDTRSGKWLMVFTLVSTCGMAAAVPSIARAMSHGSTSMDFITASGFVQLLGATLVPVMTILLVTSEWSQRGALTTFLAEPRRGRVLGAKVAVALGLALAYALISAALACAGLWAAGHMLHVSGIVQPGIGDVLCFTASNLLQTCFALGLALLLMSPAPSIVTLLVLPQVVGLLVLAGGQLARLLEWISLDAVEGHELLRNNWADHGVLKLLVASLIWVVVPMALGVRRQLRAEVK